MLNGSPEANGSSALLASGSYPLNATVFGSGFALRGWQTSGDLHVAEGVLDVYGSGTVIALLGPTNSTVGTGSSHASWWNYALLGGSLLAAGVVALLLLHRRRSNREPTIQKHSL